jgi:GxxExxY protein
MTTNELTGLVINSCIKIHSKVGPGCFEKVYEEILYYELAKLGLAVERQVLLPIDYESLHIESAYKLDLLVNKRLIIEIKSVFPLPPVFFNQVQTQLSLLNLKHGMLLNFKVPLMREGIHRVFNNFGKEEMINKSL